MNDHDLGLRFAYLRSMRPPREISPGKPGRGARECGIGDSVTPGKFPFLGPSAEKSLALRIKARSTREGLQETRVIRNT